MFVAATMPAGEGKSVTGDLSRLMPDLKWLTGQALHEVQQRVSQAWVPVTQETCQDALKVALIPPVTPTIQHHLQAPVRILCKAGLGV